jgi:hypothetical protein
MRRTTQRPTTQNKIAATTLIPISNPFVCNHSSTEESSTSTLREAHQPAHNQQALPLRPFEAPRPQAGDSEAATYARWGEKPVLRRA